MEWLLLRITLKSHFFAMITNKEHEVSFLAMLQRLSENVKPTFIRMYVSKILSVFFVGCDWKPQPHIKGCD
jgi:hypothetical protein